MSILNENIRQQTHKAIIANISILLKTTLIDMPYEVTTEHLK